MLKGLNQFKYVNYFFFIEWTAFWGFIVDEVTRLFQS